MGQGTRTGTDRAHWRGEWYVYNHLRREFLRGISRYGKRRPEDPDAPYPRWTPSIRLAKAYKNPSLAQKAASRLNAALYDERSSCWPCQPVSVVTGEAARSLELINRRDRGNEPLRCL